MRNNKLERKVTYYYVLKSLIIIFSIILLILILVLAFYKEPSFSGGGTSEAASGLSIVFLLITTILIISTLTILTLKAYRNLIIRGNYFKRGNSYLTVTHIFENENRSNIINQILRISSHNPLSSISKTNNLICLSSMDVNNLRLLTYQYF